MIAALLLSAVWASEGPMELEAESLAVREGLVVVENGQIVDEDGVLYFENGTLEPETGELNFQAVRVELASGWIILAEGLEGQLDGKAVLTQASITACNCDCPVWSVEAMALTVEGLDSAQVEGGSVVFFGGFSVPFPTVSFPLKPGDVGLGLPGLGWEQGSPRADLPVVLRLSDRWDLELRPGWWRGPYLRGESVANGKKQASWQVEWADDFAALAQVDHGFQAAHWSTAVTGFWVDRIESQRRAATYLDRQRSFLEQQGMLAWGPLRANAWAWQNAEVDAARWQLGFSEPGWQRESFFGSHSLMMGWMHGRWRSELRGQAGWSESLGPLETRVYGEFRGLDYEFEEQAGDYGLTADAGVVANGRHGHWRHEIKLGASAGLRGRAWGELKALSVLDEDPTGAAWGPFIESLWWGSGHFRLVGWASFDEAGLEGWEAMGLYKRKGLDWRVQSWRGAQVDLHGFTMYQRGERSETWFGLHAQSRDAVAYEALMNAGVRFAIPAGSYVIWPGASALMVEDELGSVTASIRVESNCDCLMVGLDSGWTADRKELTLGIALDLLPSAKQPSNWALPSPDTGSFFQP